MDNLHKRYDPYYPDTDYEATVKQFKLAVDTLINNEFITKDEFFQIVGNNFGIMFDAYYEADLETRQSLELADLETWNEFYRTADTIRAGRVNREYYDITNTRSK
jgi:hypothetical protein|tara:strand:+ start:298 stop:612 length:315 start_codon:yes stop_codon:yes gene_type:complete